jgi:hypothetical protein
MGTNGFYLNFQDDTEVEAFNAVLWKGNSPKSQSITGVGFSPSLVWVKARAQTYNHELHDVIRGPSKQIFSNLDSAEDTDANSIISFDSDGFTVGSGGATNDGGSTSTFVAWCWEAGTAVSGTTSQSKAYSGSVNTDYGFSIIKYAGSGDPAGTGPAQDVPHHLGQAPDFILVKSLGGAFGWSVYHSAIDATNPADYVIYLHTTNGRSDQSSHWNDTEPTSTNFTVGTNNGTNDNRYDHIAYCWAEKSGYSKFDSYLGDGTTDGSLEITTGFKPSFILFKKSSGTSNWNMVDSTRDVDFDGDEVLFANEAYYEGQIITGKPIEFTDTGFKIKTDEGGFNTSGQTYIYAAFADTRESAFWLDQSGNDNDWQSVNLDHNDTVADSPTDNFATWNPLFRGGEKSASIAATTTLSDGNLKASVPTNSYMGATMRPTSGQWYCEATIDTVTYEIGWGWIQATEYSATTAHAGQANKWGAEYSGYAPADIFLRDETTAIAQPTITLANGDVIQWAWDIDNGKGWLGVNNSWYDSSGGTTGNPATGSNPTFTFTSDEAENLQVYVANGTGTAVFTANFGQQPFKYDPPA